MTKIIWTQESRKLSDLKPYEQNPRFITKTAFNKLLKSIRECGYNNRLLINLDNTIVGGHARLKALKELGFDSIEVLVPNRLLSEDEFKQILITDNLDFGDYDMDILANNFDVQALLDWGLPPELFESGNSPDMEAMNDLLSESIPCSKCPFKDNENTL